ncbi:MULTISPECIES: amidohydrolase family protein [unclassified Sphingobium]|uniref:N-acyl-D-amino-acid deacylase family protein n=1 Tax=unclassified Sphingobium TaxID=2611147 RepID=UPI0035A5805F
MNDTVAHEYDLVIRGGSIIDGTGAAAFEGDIAVNAGRIVEVGRVHGQGREEIDATGQIVTPGFVDIHTHYDGQVTWDSRMQPSSWHGVTTVVMGNCGVGFAPCRPGDRDMLIRLMEGVEDIPEPVLSEGLPWNWETFPEYLDAVGARQFDVDVCAMLPHAALRVYVMGERGFRRETATPEDIARMREITGEAIAAGAFGFSTSRAHTHKTLANEPTPSFSASTDELVGIAMGLADADAGVLQVVGNPEFDGFLEMTRASGRPMSHLLSQTHGNPSAWRDALARLEQFNREGLQVRAQVGGRPVGVLMGLDLTLHPFVLHPSYAAIAGLPRAERLARLADPKFRAVLLAEEPGQGVVFDRALLTRFEEMFLLEGEPDYEQTADQSVAAIARRRGISPQELALEHMLEQDGTRLLLTPMANYCEFSLEPAREMLLHPYTLSGLSDGGAHMGTICDGSLPTYMLSYWTRDRTRGPRLSLVEAVKMQTADTAAWMGLTDRGILAEGLRADINVIDYERLKLHAPELRFDLPAGGKRLVQRADGYSATIINGIVSYRDGEETGALPGRLVRNRRAAA